jgi:hypothetical protein
MLLVDDIITITNVRHVTNILDLCHITETDVLEMFIGDEILAIIQTCERAWNHRFSEAVRFRSWSFFGFSQQ